MRRANSGAEAPLLDSEGVSSLESGIGRQSPSSKPGQMHHQGGRRLRTGCRSRCWLALALVTVVLVAVAALSAVLACGLGSPSYNDTALLVQGLTAADVANCSVYILDVSAELAGPAGIPTCSISDPKVWPHDRPGQGVQAMERTPHFAYQHAGQYWLTGAIRRAGIDTSDMETATIVWFDGYCYNQWFHSYLHRRAEQQAEMTKPDVFIRKALEAAVQLPRFQHTGGRDWAFHMPHPALISAYGAFICNQTSQSYSLVAEQGFICCRDPLKASRGDATILPYTGVADVDISTRIVGSPRPNLIYFVAGCSNSTKRSSGMLLRHQLVQMLKNEGITSDIKADCACSHCGRGHAHAALAAEMRRSTFCPIVAGDTASSARLTEVVLAGIADTRLWILDGTAVWGNSRAAVDRMGADLQLEGLAINLPSLREVATFLRARTPEDIRRRQEALERERLNIFYPEAHRRGESVLGAIVIKNMCARARRQAALVQQEATAAAPRVQAEGGEGPAGTVLEAAED